LLLSRYTTAVSYKEKKPPRLDEYPVTDRTYQILVAFNFDTLICAFNLM